jgi:hypothetical protein
MYKLILFLLLSILTYAQDDHFIHNHEFQLVNGVRMVYPTGVNILAPGNQNILHGTAALANTSALNSAMATISNNGVVVIEKGTYPLSTITIPAGVTLKCMPDAILSLQNNEVLTINGSIDAGLYQIFDTTGTVDLSNAKLKEAYSEWFGAKSDNSTICTRAIQKNINAFGLTGGIIKFNSGIYLTDEVTISHSAITLEGSGNGETWRNEGTILQSPTGDTGWVISVNRAGALGNNTGFILRNLTIKGNATAAGGLRIYDRDATDALWGGCFVESVRMCDFTKRGWQTTLSNSPIAGYNVLIQSSNGSQVFTAKDRIFIGGDGESPEACIVTVGGTGSCYVDYLMNNHTSGQLLAGAIGGIGMMLQHVQDSQFQNIQTDNCQTGFYFTTETGTNHSVENSYFARLEAYNGQNGFLMDGFGVNWGYGLKSVSQEYFDLDMDGSFMVVYGAQIEQGGTVPFGSPRSVRIRNVTSGAMVLLSDFGMLKGTAALAPNISIENSTGVELVRTSFPYYGQGYKFIRIDSLSRNVKISGLGIYAPSVGVNKYPDYLGTSQNNPYEFLDDKGYNTIVEFNGNIYTNKYDYYNSKYPYIVPNGITSQSNLNSALFGGFDVARTNLINNQNPSTWGAYSGITLISGQLSPIGDSTAYKVVNTTNGAYTGCSVTVSDTVGTFWFMAKTDTSIGYQTFAMRIYDNTAGHLLVGDNFTARNSWELYSLTSKLISGHNYLLQIYPGGIDRNNYIGDITIWKPCFAQIDHPSTIMDGGETVTGGLYDRGKTSSASQADLKPALYGLVDATRTNLISDQTFTSSADINVQSGKTDPLGTSTAYKLNNTVIANFVRYTITISDTIVTFWLMAKTDTSLVSQIFSVLIYDNTLGANLAIKKFTATNTWNLFSITTPLISGHEYLFQIYPGGRAEDGGNLGDLTVWRPCIATINHSSNMLTEGQVVPAGFYSPNIMGGAITIGVKIDSASINTDSLFFWVNGSKYKAVKSEFPYWLLLFLPLWLFRRRKA